MSFFKFLTLWDTANIKNGREEARGGGDCPKGRAQASGAGKARETSSCEKSYVRQSSNCCLSLDGEVCSVFRVIRHHLKIDKVSYETKLFWCNIIRKRISFFPVFPHLSSRPSVQALLPSPILVLFFQVLAVLSTIPPFPRQGPGRFNLPRLHLSLPTANEVFPRWPKKVVPLVKASKTAAQEKK